MEGPNKHVAAISARRAGRQPKKKHQLQTAAVVRIGDSRGLLIVDYPDIIETGRGIVFLDPHDADDDAPQIPAVNAEQRAFIRQDHVGAIMEIRQTDQALVVRRTWQPPA
jgi:hypothetical protein